VVNNPASYTAGLSLTRLLSSNDYTRARSRSHRTAMELVTLILEAVKENSATHYSLMKYTSTNYTQVKKYLELLTGIGFIETDTRNDKVFYEVSVRGLAFLRQYSILRGMLLDALYGSKPTDFFAREHNRPVPQEVQTQIRPTN